MTEAPRATAASAIGGSRAWFVWALGALSFGYAFFQRVTPSVMVSDLMRDFAVGAAVLGNLSALYFYAYAGLQIPVGVMVDRWGARRMIASALTLAAVGSLLFGMAENIGLAYAGRLMIGFGSAFGFVGTLSLISRWFPPHRFAFLSGLTMFVAMMAGIGGQAPLAAVVETAGWRATMVAAGVFGFVLAAMVWLVVRNTPDHAAPEPARKSGGHMLRDLKETLTDLRVCNIALAALSLSGPMLAVGGLWGVPYLIARYGVDRPQAAFIASLMFVGWAVGAPTSGWLSDRIRRRKLPMVAAAALALASLAAAFYVPGLPLAATGALFFITGLCSSMMVVCFALVREITAPDIHGTVIGFVNGSTVAAGALFQPAIGGLLDLWWAGGMSEGARIYEVGTYHAAFGLLIGFGFVALGCTLLMPETGCKPLDRPSRHA